MSDATMRLVHPLDDEPEQKLYHDNVAPMVITRTVRTMLWLLQAYLVLMLALVLYRGITLALA